MLGSFALARHEVKEARYSTRPVDLIHDLPSAASLVGVLAAQAEDALNRAGRRLGQFSRTPRAVPE